MAQPIVEPCSQGVIEAQPCPAEVGPAIAPRHRRAVLAACILASAMGFVDGSVLTVALPRLRADLGADLASVQWILNGYVLVLASLTLIGGALADAYGKARILALGCALFGVSSIACALAPGAGWLIVARVVQGVGAALLTPASLALVGAIYPRERRNAAIGIWAAASAIATAGGPILGGWLVDSAGWQAIFWINPPLAVVAIALLAAFAPADRGEARRFDFPGAAILAAALLVIAWALSTIGPRDATDASRSSASPALVLAAIAVAAAGFVAYALWERTIDYAMTPRRLAANRLFISLNAATVVIYAGLSIMFFLLPFELVDRRGLTATEAGLTFLPFTLGVGLLSKPFGGLADRVGARALLIVGPAGAAVAFGWMAVGQNGSLLFGVIAPMALLGVSFAILIAPLTASVLSSVAHSDEGVASGTNNAASRIAQLAGVAAAAGIASYSGGYRLGLVIAAVCSLAGAAIAATMAKR
jgi:EmrB/QacA subfamily drug resistance transporter